MAVTGAVVGWCLPHALISTNVFESQYAAGSFPQLRLHLVFGPVSIIVMFPTCGHAPVGSVDPYVDQSWMPTLNENCELLYLDGWWPVKVKKIEKGDKWHVMYEAFGVMHVVSRKQLRQAVRWDAESQSFKPDAK